MFSKVTNEKLQVRSDKSNTKSLSTILYCLFFVLFSLTSNAQCAMCRAALGGDANKAQAQAVNDGIVYLMVIPYILVGGIGYYIYRMRTNKKQE
ncbi:hypothetical protein [uncultured Flavobacterium sp.]|jgi:hypothetical protein|uniref:hypothetical protein n=1 Tax=uncultured Flavobacterium sp. TaxID=165435 RepID=UPI0030CA47A1